MGYKKVCFTCRKAFSVYNNNADEINLTCPECGKQTIIFSHLFRPPKQDELKKWKVAEFLSNHGFVYQHIYNVKGSIYEGGVQYPLTIESAKEFVVKYKDQSYKK